MSKIYNNEMLNKTNNWCISILDWLELVDVISCYGGVVFGLHRAVGRGDLYDMNNTGDVVVTPTATHSYCTCHLTHAINVN